MLIEYAYLTKNENGEDEVIVVTIEDYSAEFEPNEKSNLQFSYKIPNDASQKVSYYITGSSEDAHYSNKEADQLIADIKADPELFKMDTEDLPASELYNILKQLKKANMKFTNKGRE